jgi:hypothetical protein
MKQNTHRNEAKYKYKGKSCKRSVICERLSSAFVFIRSFLFCTFTCLIDSYERDYHGNFLIIGHTESGR